MPSPWMPPLDITPEEYERQVAAQLRRSGLGLLEFRVTRREKLAGVDGIYEIDAVVRFEALGASFIVLVECKLTKRPVDRDAIQVLHDRVRSTGAH
jgi:restriction system protein